LPDRAAWLSAAGSWSMWWALNLLVRFRIAEQQQRLRRDPLDVVRRLAVAVQRRERARGRLAAAPAERPGDAVVAHALAAALDVGRSGRADQRDQQRLGLAQLELAGAPDRTLERPRLGGGPTRSGPTHGGPPAEPSALRASPCRRAGRVAARGQSLEDAPGARVLADRDATRRARRFARTRRGRRPRGRRRCRRRGRRAALLDVAGIELGAHQLVERALRLVALHRRDGLGPVLERGAALAVAKVDDELVRPHLAQIDLVDLVAAACDEDEPGLLDEPHPPASFRIVPCAR
jgi:hypothetical protein